MSTEDKLKSYILERYKSLREFTIEVDLPYSTLDSVLKRGIGNSSVNVIFKICKALNISPDALGEGEIVPKGTEIMIEIKEVDDILEDTKNRLRAYQNLLLDGKPADKESINSIVTGIDLSVEMVKRNIKS